MTYPSRYPGVAAAPFRAGMLLHEVHSGRLFHLNGTAARIWPWLRETIEPKALVDRLVALHEVDPARARGDVAAFLASLHGAGLKPAPRPRPAGGTATSNVPARPPALDGVYRVGSGAVNVRCFAPRLALAFERLAAPARVADETRAGASLIVYRERGRLVLVRDGRVIGRFLGAPAARWQLVRELVASANRPWLALLHASAAATPWGTLLISGDSGSGKSTLLAGLLHAGMDYVADDILPLEAGTGLVWPTRLAISVKQSSWPVVAPLFPELRRSPVTRFGGRIMRYLCPGERAGEAGRGYPATAILFPRYRPDARTALARIDAVRALILLGEGGSVLPSTDAGLAEFIDWLQRVPAYELPYGLLAEGVRAAGSLLEGPGAGPGGGVAMSRRGRDAPRPASALVAG